jgi:hypothetical protein
MPSAFKGSIILLFFIQSSKKAQSSGCLLMVAELLPKQFEVQMLSAFKSSNTLEIEIH